MFTNTFHTAGIELCRGSARISKAMAVRGFIDRVPYLFCDRVAQHPYNFMMSRGHNSSQGLSGNEDSSSRPSWPRCENLMQQPPDDNLGPIFPLSPCVLVLMLAFCKFELLPQAKQWYLNKHCPACFENLPEQARILDVRPEFWGKVERFDIKIRSGRSRL